MLLMFRSLNYRGICFTSNSETKAAGVALKFNDVIQSKYLLLTTFTKDGRRKPTPIWGVPDGDKLLVITDDGS